MAYKNTPLSEHGDLRLFKSVKAKGSIKYIIQASGYFEYSAVDRLCKLFDPIGNRRISGLFTSWKFNTRAEAEQLLAVAVLRGLDKARWSKNE